MKSLTTWNFPACTYACSINHNNVIRQPYCCAYGLVSVPDPPVWKLRKISFSFFPIFAWEGLGPRLCMAYPQLLGLSFINTCVTSRKVWEKFWRGGKGTVYPGKHVSLWITYFSGMCWGERVPLENTYHCNTKCVKPHSLICFVEREIASVYTS